jgi:hypothetical protein
MKKYAATISTIALGFQVFVLEPWHQQISNEIRELKESVSRSQKLE